MKTLSWMAGAALLALVVALPARAADDDPVPNINKRGKDEKAFAAKVAEAIVKTARTSIKSAELENFKSKAPKAGRTEWHLTTGFKTAALKRNAQADIVVHIDTSDKDKWEVLRIEYKDNVKSLTKPNRKNLDAMVDKLNGK
jgi:hypothetical protein